MDKNNHIDECKDESVPHLPMGRLFYMLHSNGFNVKPDDYIEMLKITERFGSTDIDATAKWICPIIATSATEQAGFYNIIEQYKKTETLPPCDELLVKKNIPRVFKITVIAVAAILLLLVISLSLQKKRWVPQETNRERTIEKGEPLLLDASDLLRNSPADTSQIQFSWQFNDGSTQQGTRVSHVFKEAGDFRVIRRFSSRSLRLATESDSLLIHVCNDLPKVNIKIPAEAVMVNQPFTITAAVDAETGTVSYYLWTINDSVFTTASPAVRNFVFAKEGDYPVECKAIVTDVHSPCSGSDNAIIQVINNNTHYGARFSDAKPGFYTSKTKLKWWVTMVLLLPAVAGLLYSFFKRIAKTDPLPENKPVSNSVTRGPYNIPFEQNDTKLIQPEKDLRHALIQMRYKAEEETLAINISGTIRSIIRSGGSPQLVFAPITRQQQYLILIDQTNPKNMLTHFFGYLAKTMAEDGIPIVIFYYDKNFVCYNDRNPAGLSLQKLADAWQHATMIILGRAHELVYTVYPVMEEKYWRELSRWQNKAIITPVPLKDWGARERVLQDYIILLPADVSALQKLIPALKEKIKLNKTLLEITVTGQYSLRDTDFRDVDDLQDYLGGDETVFQWLCAICVYPRLEWEVLIEMGKTILDKYGQPEALNYSNLLKLCRISWMQQGAFPQATRLELLKLLKTENEIYAREKLLHLLNYSTRVYADSGYFFEEERNRQVLTNQFILHASNNNLYAQYAGSKEAFKKIWQKDAILDVPVKKYLDKKGGDSWQTPVNDGKHSIGLADYFNLPAITLDKSLRRKKTWMAAASLLLIFFWIYIGYGGGAEKLAPLFTLSQLKDQGRIPVEMKIIKNFRHCGDSLKQGFDRLDGYLEINNKRFPLSYNQKTATALFEVPYENFIAGRALLMFAWDINKSVLAKLDLGDKRLPDSVTIGCLNTNRINKRGLYIRYNDESGYKNMESTLNNALFRYRIDALPAAFSDSSRIVYYETNQKPVADSIARIIKQALNIDVKEEFIYEARTPPATPILFLNTSVLPGAVGANDDAIARNKEDAGDYQRMGDTYMMKNQYQEAIQQYNRAIKLNPQNALAHYQLGVCYEMLGDANLEKALAAYTSAIRLDAGDALFYYRRASVKYELKRYADAIPDYDKVIAMNAAGTKKQYISSLYFRGKSKFFLNRLAAACEDFKKAGDAGMAAGKKDYGMYCAVPNKPPDAAQDYNQAAPQNETDLGSVELDQKGNPNNAGLQLMESIARLLKAQAGAKIRLTAFYTTDMEAKTQERYMNNLASLFQKYGITARTQVVQQQIQEPQQQQQNANAQAFKTISIKITGINLQDNRNKSKY